MEFRAWQGFIIRHINLKKIRNANDNVYMAVSNGKIKLKNSLRI